MLSPLWPPCSPEPCMQPIPIRFLHQDMPNVNFYEGRTPCQICLERGPSISSSLPFQTLLIQSLGGRCPISFFETGRCPADLLSSSPKFIYAIGVDLPTEEGQYKAGGGRGSRASTWAGLELYLSNFLGHWIKVPRHPRVEPHIWWGREVKTQRFTMSMNFGMPASSRPHALGSRRDLNARPFGRNWKSFFTLTTRVPMWVPNVIGFIIC